MPLSKNQGCGVGSKISDSESNLSEISDSGLSEISNTRIRPVNIKGMEFGCWNQWKSWYTARNLCFNKSFKRNCTISTGCNLWVWCKKWSNWTSGVGVGQKIRLSLPVLSGIRLHPKTSESLRLRLRLRLPDPGKNTVTFWNTTTIPQSVTLKIGNSQVQLQLL